MINKRGKNARVLITLIAVLLLIFGGILVSRKIFADVESACSGADVDLIPVSKGDFETASVFDVSSYTNQGATSWFYSGSQSAPVIQNKRLILGSKAVNPTERPVNPYIYYKFSTPLRKEKLYEFKVQFETDFGQNDEKVFPRIGVIRNGSGIYYSAEKLKSTADNVLTENTSYFSVLRDLSESGTSSTPDYFYLTLNNNNYDGQDTFAGILKIKKISVKESCLSPVAKTNPNFYKTIVSPYTYTPSGSSIPVSAFAYHMAIPWNIGERNALVAAPTPTPTPAQSTQKFSIFDHDTDSLEPFYQPSQNEIIGQNAPSDGTKSLATTAAKGEKKRVYFSLHNNSDLSDVNVSVSNFIPGEDPPPVTVSPTPTVTVTESPSVTPTPTVTVTESPSVTPTPAVTVTESPTVTTTVTITETATPVPVKTQSFKVGKGWTTIGPEQALNTADLSGLGLYVFQMYGSKWKVSNPGGNSFYAAAPSALYVYNPSDAKDVTVNVADISSVPETEHVSKGWNLLFNDSDSDVPVGKYMIKSINGSVTQSASLYSLANQGVAYSSVPVVLSTQDNTASYDYIDLSKSGSVIPAKSTFWFYMFDNWPSPVSKINNPSIAYAADESTAAITPSGTIDSMRLKAKQPKEGFTGVYSYVNEIVEPFSQMSETSQNNLKAGRNESFAVEVDVPGNISAGWYAANINIKVDGQQEYLPVKIRVRDFALENINSPRIVYPPNEIWYNNSNCKVGVTTGCDEFYKQIDSFTDELLNSGFNGFELSAVVGDGRYLGEITPTTGSEVTGFTLSPSSEYLLKKAKTDSRITSKYLVGYENLVGELLYRKGFIAQTEKSDYVKQSILLGLEKPVNDALSIYHKQPYLNDAKYNTLVAKSPGEIDQIKEELKTILNSINTQVTDLTGKSNFWTYYPVDEALRGDGELAMGKFNADLAKSIGVDVFITGTDRAFKQSLSEGVKFDDFCFGVDFINNETLANMSGKTPCFYGTGAYDDMAGSEVRNRFLSGFRSFEYGINYMLFWKYTNAQFGADQMNEFNQSGLSDSGRDWLTQYYNNNPFQQSYLDYYGTKKPVEDLAATNKYQNVTTQQYVGLEEANTDLKYLETLAKKIGWNAVKTKLDNLPDDLKLPKIRRTLYGTNMTKAKLDKIRDIIADEIER